MGEREEFRRGSELRQSGSNDDSFTRSSFLIDYSTVLVLLVNSRSEDGGWRSKVKCEISNLRYATRGLPRLLDRS